VGEQQLGAAVHCQVSLCAIALATCSWSSAALADQVPAPPAPKDSGSQIVITGSRIPHTNLTAVSPVTIVRGEEFKLQGATNAEEVLDRLPQVNPSQGEFVSAGAWGTATVDLRGLGAVRTLVLINGHRLTPGDPRFPVPDINNIPTALIQRVEVLTGGSAAVYGSDAVAGVVNFILDTRLDGFRAEGLIGGYQHDNRDTFMEGLLDQRDIRYAKGSALDGRRDDFSVAFGRSLFDSRAHVTLYGGYRRIAGVTQDRRDYSPAPSPRKSSTTGHRRSWNAAARFYPIPGTSSTGWEILTRSRPTGCSCLVSAGSTPRRSISFSGRTSATPPAGSRASTFPGRSGRTPK
jgi:outer membrane receptor protein involved in Fe transport